MEVDWLDRRRQCFGKKKEIDDRSPPHPFFDLRGGGAAKPQAAFENRLPFLPLSGKG